MKILLKLMGTVFVLSMIISCDNIWNNCIDGNGDREVEVRETGPFTRMQVNGDFQIDIDTGDVTSLNIEADENLLNAIVTHVSGNKLIIESRNGVCLRPSRPIEITITVPYLTEVQLNGSGYIYCFGMETEELEVLLSGSGEIDVLNIMTNILSLELEGSGVINSTGVTEDFEARIEGSGEIRATGTAVSSELGIIGSGRIKAGDMITNVCNASISGSGIINTHVLTALDISIIGSGTVYYEGDPTVESFISGSGRVIQE